MKSMKIKIGKFEFEGTMEEFKELLEIFPELMGILRRGIGSARKRRRVHGGGKSEPEKR